MADFVVTSMQYAAVTRPAGVDVKMQVHNAPVRVTFGDDMTTKGLLLRPGDVIAIKAGDNLKAAKTSRLLSPVLSFEVFG